MSCSRRRFLQQAAVSVGGLCISEALCSIGTRQRSALAQQKGTSVDALPRPTAAQLRWQECEIGLIYHFDLPIAARRFAGNNTVRERLDPDLYQPIQLDTDQWLEAAKAAGARYAIFTATHFNGFMQWQSDLYPYGLKQTSWRDGRGDVVGDFVESCRRAGILPGIYFSTHRNVYWTVWGHYVDWGKGKGTDKQAAFNRIAEKMTEELCSRYGPLVQIWYDAGVKTPAEGGPDVLPIFERHQPEAVFYHNVQRSDHRWVGNEHGHAGDPCWATMPGRPGEVSHNHPSWRSLLATGDPDGSYWSPAMVDVPLRGARGVHNWFWKPEQDHAVYSTETLMKMYHQSVGRNANLVIGEVVTSDGLVPESDIARLAEFGRLWKTQYGKPLATTSGRGGQVELVLPQPAKIDRLVLQEQIAEGERVRRYRVDGLGEDGRWERLYNGQSIGHKRIAQTTPTQVARLRLTVEQSNGEPLIRTFAAYG